MNNVYLMYSEGTREATPADTDPGRAEYEARATMPASVHTMFRELSERLSTGPVLAAHTTIQVQATAQEAERAHDWLNSRHSGAAIGTFIRVHGLFISTLRVRVQPDLHQLRASYEVQGQQRTCTVELVVIEN